MSRQKRPIIAIAYDFDGTLAPNNMQEYDFIPALNMKPKAFWKEATALAKDNNADPILAYMQLMLKKAVAADVKVKKESFQDFGSNVVLFDGVESWFSRINAFAKAMGIEVQHFIISSGLREMIEGTKISKEFKKIYASGFMYDVNGVANWPALAINYTTKTQYLFRINKGSLDEDDNTLINKYVDDAERPIPFSQMIFIGDGETDVPCMRLVKSKGGHAIAVYPPSKKGAQLKAQQLVSDGRASLVAVADYTANSALEKSVKAMIRLVAAQAEISKFKKA